MKTTLIFAAALAAAAGASAGTLSKNALIECRPAVCGKLAQNLASYSLSRGSSVAVDTTGLVTVTVVSLRDKATGSIAAGKTLQLYYGTLQDHVARATYLGSFVTDANGNYAGPVTDINGNSYSFPRGPHTGSFIVNDDSIPASEFSTGFRVR